MQAVVSEGASPLPAELRLKYDAVHPDQFFGIDPSPWPQESPPSYIYDSAMQIKLRRLFAHVAVRTFAQMKYKFEVIGKFLPSFDMHPEMMIDKVIPLVD